MWRSEFPACRPLQTLLDTSFHSFWLFSVCKTCIDASAVLRWHYPLDLIMIACWECLRYVLVYLCFSISASYLQCRCNLDLIEACTCWYVLEMYILQEKETKISIWMKKTWLITCTSNLFLFFPMLNLLQYFFIFYVGYGPSSIFVFFSTSFGDLVTDSSRAVSDSHDAQRCRANQALPLNY